MLNVLCMAKEAGGGWCWLHLSHPHPSVKDWRFHPLWTFPSFCLCFFMIILVSNTNCYWEARLSPAAWKSNFQDWTHPSNCEIVFQLYRKVHYVKDHNFRKWPFCACYCKIVQLFYCLNQTYMGTVWVVYTFVHKHATNLLLTCFTKKLFLSGTKWESLLKKITFIQR
jgi:hypothetical protein